MIRSTAFFLAASLLFGGSSCGFAADLKRTLITHADPVYPELAKRMLVTGTIVLDIVIEPDGRVVEVKAEGGHPLLVHAGEEAVRRWLYSAAPGTTTAVVRVNFNL